MGSPVPVIFTAGLGLSVVVVGVPVVGVALVSVGVSEVVPGLGVTVVSVGVGLVSVLGDMGGIGRGDDGEIEGARVVPDLVGGVVDDDTGVLGGGLLASCGISGHDGA